MIGWRELIIVFLIIFLLFGAKKLPQVARALGKAKKEFENPTDEEEEEEQKKNLQPPEREEEKKKED